MMNSASRVCLTLTATATLLSCSCRTSGNAADSPCAADEAGTMSAPGTGAGAGAAGGG